MNSFWFDVLFCIAYILSGAVILACLRKVGFKLARRIFCALYITLMAYVPFYLGGTLMIKLLSWRMEYNTAYFYVKGMRETLAAPTPLFHSVSIIMSLLAIFVVCATAIVLIFIALEVVTVVKKVLAFYRRVANDDSIYFAPVYQPYVAAKNRKYLEFSCLLN